MLLNKYLLLYIANSRKLYCILILYHKHSAYSVSQKVMMMPGGQWFKNMYTWITNRLFSPRNEFIKTRFVWKLCYPIILHLYYEVLDWYDGISRRPISFTLWENPALISCINNDHDRWWWRDLLKYICDMGTSIALRF